MSLTGRRRSISDNQGIEPRPGRVRRTNREEGGKNRGHHGLSALRSTPRRYLPPPVRETPSLFSCSPERQSNRAARALTIIKVADEKLKIHHRSRKLETFRLKKRKEEDPVEFIIEIKRERPFLPRGANRWPRMEYARRRGFRPRWWCVMWCIAGWKRVGTKENREEERKNARRICAGLCTSEGTPIA